MIIPSIKRTDPDKVFTVIRNDEATLSMTDGDLVIWVTAASKNYGVDCLMSTGAAQVICAGIISGDNIAPDYYGLCQIYGYHSNVKVDDTVIAAGGTAISSVTSRKVGVGAAADDPS